MLRQLFLKSEMPTPIDGLIDAVLDRMRVEDVLSEDYRKMMKLLERLYKLKAGQRRKPVSRDAIIMVAGNLMGILVIVAYEQKHVMTSKGFTQLIRPKGTT